MAEPIPPLTREEAEEAPRPLRELLAAGLEALRTRIDLAAVEVEIYLITLVRTLAWIMGAAVCFLIALALGVTALMVSLWDAHRMLGLLGGSVVFVCLAAAFGYLATRALRQQGGFLEGTLGQLDEDQRRASREP